RHLRRYDDALKALRESEDILRRLASRSACIPASRTFPCDEIARQLRLTHTYFANVYIDLNDDLNAKKHLDAALQSAATLKEYEDSFAAILRWHIAGGRFAAALNLLLTEMELLFASKKTEALQELAKLADEFYLRLFRTISWLPGTDARRNKDP